MAKRVCMGPSQDVRCPTAALIASGKRRCPACSTRYELARGTRQQRGYDAEHDRERARWAPKVRTGRVPCRRCRKPIPSDALWDLGHPDAGCPRPRAPEHEACNRGVNGRA